MSLPEIRIEWRCGEARLIYYGKSYKVDDLIRSHEAVQAFQLAISNINSIERREEK